MLEATYTPVYDENNVLVKHVMTLLFNGKVCNAIDFPAGQPMTQDEVDLYIAGKLSGLLY